MFRLVVNAYQMPTQRVGLRFGFEPIQGRFGQCVVVAVAPVLESPPNGVRLWFDNDADGLSRIDGDHKTIAVTGTDRSGDEWIVDERS